MRASCAERWGRRAGRLLPLLLVATACGGEGREAGDALGRRPEGLPERRLRPMAWDTLFRVGGTLRDTLLLDPHRVVADAGGPVVLDVGGSRVVRFDTAGRLLWSYGREGGGPNEFARVRDLALDGQGRAWILDVDNARVTVLEPDGRVARRIPLNEVEVRLDQIVPLPGDTLLGFGYDHERPLVVLDHDGTMLERTPFPWEPFRELNQMATQVETRRDPSSNRWAAGFAMGDGFFLFRGSRWLGYRGWFVEAVPFPRVVTETSVEGRSRSRTTWIERSVFAARSLSFTRGRLLVHFHGRGEHRDRVLDSYRPEDGAYLESVLLPRPVSAVATRGDDVYAVYSDPSPGLVAWRAREPLDTRR